MISISIYELNSHSIRNKYYLFYLHMVSFSFHSPSAIAELNVQFGLICPECTNPFDQKKRMPYRIYPCQHLICEECWINKLDEGEDRATCSCADVIISKENTIKSELLLKIVEIRDKYHDQPAEEIQKAVATELSNLEWLQFCKLCDQPFNNETNQPLIVCRKEHLICYDCFKKKDLRNCSMCSQKLVRASLSPSQTIINICDFITKTCYNKKITFVVDDKQFQISTHEDTKIKHLFFLLQEFHSISDKLEITLCRFIVESRRAEGEQSYKQEVKYEEKIGPYAETIYLEFDEKALSMGSKVTQPSKIVKKLPIKISDFQPIRVIEEDSDEQYGKQQKLQVSNYSHLSEKHLYEEEREIPRMRQNQASQIHYPKIESMVRRSQIAGPILEQKKQMNRIIKQSKINSKVIKKPVGTEIPEKFVQNVNTEAPEHLRAKIFQSFLENHEVKEQEEALLAYMTEKIVNRPFTQGQLEISEKMEKQIEKKALEGDNLSLILMLLRQELRDGQIKVIISPKSTERSRLSLKIITSHYLCDRFIVKQVIDQDQKWYFEKLYDSEKQFRTFIKEQKKKYAARFVISQQNIVIHNLIKGSCKLVFSTNEGSSFSKNIQYNVDKDLEIHPYFNQLELSPQDFDSKGYIKFRQSYKAIEFRGNWPYYQPIKSIRYGIKVLGMFDQKNNTWLKMNNVPGEWAVGFHGVRNPNQAYKHYKNVIESILAGMHMPGKSMLIVVQNSKQFYQSTDCANHPGQKVGSGVYLSPMFAETLPYTSAQRVGDKQYHLVFQCRLNPSFIRIPTNKQNYWVVRRSAAIRPYGIVLIESKNVANYPKPADQFGQNFSYAKYKERIQKK